MAGSDKETSEKDDKNTCTIKPEEHNVNNELPCQKDESKKDDKEVQVKSAQDKKED